MAYKIYLKTILILSSVLLLIISLGYIIKTYEIHAYKSNNSFISAYYKEDSASDYSEEHDSFKDRFEHKGHGYGRGRTITTSDYLVFALFAAPLAGILAHAGINKLRHKNHEQTNASTKEK